MTPDDLPFYEQYIKLMEGERGVRLILSYPDDYISLLREVKRLRDDNARLKMLEVKYCEEMHRSLALEDKLRYIRKYLREVGVTIPNLIWRD